MRVALNDGAVCIFVDDQVHALWGHNEHSE